MDAHALKMAASASNKWQSKHQAAAHASNMVGHSLTMAADASTVAEHA